MVVHSHIELIYIDLNHAKQDGGGSILVILGGAFLSRGVAFLSRGESIFDRVSPKIFRRSAPKMLSSSHATRSATA